ncbi:MAG: caspase family protein [Fluviicoccus sp.]|uniref:caspase family protein n=1 Tax=Fluviicoccus sp. TaxID=2003552 RepID=UPI0027160CB7|nr:caspase family protein [Fluviicoccus sp.]MDO8332126.1 caspase family protein [Fluviicoccus sp.]
MQRLFHRRAALCALALLVSGWQAPAQAAARALVVGIKDYAYWSRLQNSRNDAEDMAQTLRDLGFETTLLVRDGQGEVDSERLRAAVAQFSRDLRPDDRVVFFYSGHGAAVPDGAGSTEGYLIPANAPAPGRSNKQAIRDSAVALKGIAESLGNRIDPDTGSILFLIDACRNEVVNKGADVVEESTPSQPLTKQVEVIYATSNGSTSLDKLPGDNAPRNNGVFTRVAIEELRRHKDNPGYSSDAFFPAVKSRALQLAKAAGKSQVPAWMNDTGKESFVFVPCPAGQACNVLVDNRVTVNAPPSADQLFWESVKDSTDAGDYAAYLKQYPQGAFAALAEARRDKYQPSSGHSVLDSLRLPEKPSVQDLQQERERNPGGTSIYDALSLKTDKPGSRVEALRLPEGDGCSKLVLDLNRGRLNGLPPTLSQSQVKQALPCFTGDTPDGEVYNYGGGVFFLDHDFFMYTGKDFIEVRADFKGSITPALLGKSDDEVTAIYGQPSAVESGRLYFTTAYGCLRFTFGSQGVREIRVHAASCEAAGNI